MPLKHCGIYMYYLDGSTLSYQQVILLLIGFINYILLCLKKFEFKLCGFALLPFVPVYLNMLSLQLYVALCLRRSQDPQCTLCNFPHVEFRKVIWRSLITSEPLIYELIKVSHFSDLYR